MRRIKAVLRVVNIALTAIVALLLAANVYMIAARFVTKTPQPTLFGFSWAVVISGSMEPDIRVNDLIIAQEKEYYAVGDVITYSTGSSAVTHRIIDGDGEEGFITKGDANNTPDTSPVSKEQVIGKVIAVVPSVGTFIAFLRTPLGMLCLVLIGFLLIEIPYLLERQREDRG